VAPRTVSPPAKRAHHSALETYFFMIVYSLN
jgi:hypothetical protein